MDSALSGGTCDDAFRPRRRPPVLHRNETSKAVTNDLKQSAWKPGFDAYRVLKGEKKDPLLRVDPMMEIAMSKGIELAPSRRPSLLMC